MTEQYEFKSCKSQQNVLGLLLGKALWLYSSFLLDNLQTFDTVWQPFSYTTACISGQIWQGHTFLRRSLEEFITSINKTESLTNNYSISMNYEHHHILSPAFNSILNL